MLSERQTAAFYKTRGRAYCNEIGGWLAETVAQLYSCGEGQTVHLTPTP